MAKLAASEAATFCSHQVRETSVLFVVPARLERAAKTDNFEMTNFPGRAVNNHLDTTQEARQTQCIS